MDICSDGRTAWSVLAKLEPPALMLLLRLAFWLSIKADMFAFLLSTEQEAALIGIR